MKQPKVGRNMMHTCSNDALDRAFTKLNMYYFATQDVVVKEIFLKQLEDLSQEIVKRDSSLKFKFKQYFYTLKKKKKHDQRNSS